MNKSFVSSILLLSLLLLSTASFANKGKGLNVIVTTAEQQAQMMAMVLSVQTIKKHGKAINMVLCSSAGDLALKSTKTEVFQPAGKSPTQLLKGLIKMGASVQVCPLYLPSAGKTKADLIDGITVAKPPAVAARLLDTNFTTLSF